MAEFEKYVDDNFFIISSEDIPMHMKKLFGYVIENNQIILNYEDVGNLDGNGAYVLINSDNENITIEQDFNGSYGLYLYKSEEYFAISNSFLKLVEYLKDKQFLSFNKDYANAFLFTNLCSFVYGETLVNEIEVLPRNYRIIINKKNKSIVFEEIDYKEHTIDLDSKKGVETLDNWYFKWINIIRLIRSKTNNLGVDLSGGVDSRAVMILALNSNINLEKIKINSITKEGHCYEEDYVIASEIAEEFNFNLNNNIVNNYYKFRDINTCLGISFYPKLGFHKHSNFTTNYAIKPNYWITGAGGEYIKQLRTKYRLSSEKFIKLTTESSNNHHESLTFSSKKICEKSLKKLGENYPNINNKELPIKLYKEVRGRNHFGKGLVEDLSKNSIKLTPFIDVDLHKIKTKTSECEDNSLLMALIFIRYCPKLLNFRFQGNRKFKEETIEYAKKISEKYPFKPKKEEFIYGPENDLKVDKKSINNSLKNNINNKPITTKDVLKLLKNTFYSTSFEVKFKEIFNPILYNKIAKNIETKNHQPIAEVYSAISILYIFNCINHENEYDNIFDWIKSFSKEKIPENRSLNLISQFYEEEILQLKEKNDLINKENKKLKEKK